MKRLYVFSGPVQSGKSSRLMEWVQNTPSVEGILQLVINDIRWLRDIGTGETRILEADSYSDTSDLINVGRFYFYSETLQWARERLEEGFKQNPDWIVIDEIGKLELDNKGLQPVVTDIIKSKNNDSTKILVVVRDKLYHKFKYFFYLTDNDVKPFSTGF